MAKVDCSFFLVPCQHPDLKVVMIFTISTMIIMQIMTMTMVMVVMTMKMDSIFTLMPACFRSLTVSTT